MTKIFLLPIVCLSFLLLQGCSMTPWVKPYERAHLADPVMNFNRDPVSSNYIHHVYDAREGARGAGVATGGGCGCN
ncbi:MAG: DUF4266 domain-containing protein [Gammaproteobacteria bacterium]|nr:DUF4266 domain-containing protein [Gammaproteobacteria bacterium]